MTPRPQFQFFRVSVPVLTVEQALASYLYWAIRANTPAEALMYAIWARRLDPTNREATKLIHSILFEQITQPELESTKMQTPVQITATPNVSPRDEKSKPNADSVVHPIKESQSAPMILATPPEVPKYHYQQSRPARLGFLTNNRAKFRDNSFTTHPAAPATFRKT